MTSQETATTENPTAETPENRGRPAEESTEERKSSSELAGPDVTPCRMRTFPIRGPLLKQVVELVAEPLKTTGRLLHLVADLSSSRTENTSFNASWKRPCMPQGIRPRAPEATELVEA